jgi:hypothetical protein
MVIAIIHFLRTYRLWETLYAFRHGLGNLDNGDRYGGVTTAVAISDLSLNTYCQSTSKEKRTFQPYSHFFL